MCTMKIPNPSSGPEPPIRFWTALPAMRAAHSKLTQDLIHEPLGRETSRSANRACPNEKSTVDELMQGRKQKMGRWLHMSRSAQMGNPGNVGDAIPGRVDVLNAVPEVNANWIPG